MRRGAWTGSWRHGRLSWGEESSHKILNITLTTPDREENQMVKFSEMHYERPDMDTLKAKLQEAVSNISEAQSYEEVRRICFEIQE